MNNLTKVIISILAIMILTAVGCGKKQKKQSENNGSYTVTLYDENGDKLTEQTLQYGTVPYYTYNKTDTAEWDYTVDGWALTKDGNVLQSLPAVSENAEYFAIVSQEKQRYALSFETNGGSTVTQIVAEYGTEISEPNNPTKDGYAFVAW